MQVPIRVFPGGEGLDLPRYQTVDAAGCDLRAAVVDAVVLAPGERALIPTGIGIALPTGFEAQVRPRSGLAWKHGITVINSPGTIDADYRGEIKVPLVNLGDTPFEVCRGERIAQLVVAPCTQVDWALVEELSDSVRGGAGFGSTGV